MLQDDTRRQSHNNVHPQCYDKRFFEEIENISNFTVNRLEYSLSSRNLKFICYDDSDHDDEKVASSLDVLLESVQLDSEVKTVRHGEAASEQEGKPKREACICESCPLFPSDRNVTRLRIVHAGTLAKTYGLSKAECQHYVAVSYCWPKDEHGNGITTQGSYQVRFTDENDITRKRHSRAPDAILGRAIEFAKTVGARLIWIDQECLPQDESEEHFLGIQSMDIIYEKSRWTIGIVDGLEMGREDLYIVGDVLNSLYDQQTSIRVEGLTTEAGAKLSGNDIQRLRDTNPGEYSRHVNGIKESFSEMLLNFLRRLMSAPWSKRAWIFQEILSADSRAILLIKQEKDAKFNAPSEVLTYGQVIPDAFLISMSDMMSFLQQAKVLLETLRPVYRGVGYIQEEKLASVLNDLEVFYPYPPNFGYRGRPQTRALQMDGRETRGRPACNAAAAMSFLSGRENSVTSDRIAIVGNLCQYGKRLDALKIEENFTSLMTCILVLSILNGDLSLLSPELYPPYRDRSLHHGPSWMLPIHELISNVHAPYLRSNLLDHPKRSGRHIIRDASLSVPGYLWKVDRSIDFRHIQARLASVWEDAKTFQTVTLLRRIPESSSDGAARQHKDCTSGSIRNDSHQTEEQKEEKLRVSNFQEALKLFSEFDSDDVCVRVKARRMAMDRNFHSLQLREVFGRIYFEILWHLCQTHNVALAESIWHSIRAEYLQSPSSGTWTDEYRHVAEVLPRFQDNPKRFWTAIGADGYNVGDFCQVWIIERIMRTGKLWVGSYVRSPLVDLFNWENSARYTGERGNWARYWPHDCIEIALEAPKESDRAHNRYWMAKAGGHGSLLPMPEVLRPKTANWESLPTVRPPEWRPYAEAARLNLVSAFDVDSPCTVLTPYDSDVETLPRQERRGMSICWVVDRIEGKELSQPGEQHRSMDQIRDIRNCPVLKIPFTYRTTSDGTLKPGEDPKCTFEKLCFWRAPRDKIEDFRILKRVKGAWEAMDEPIQEYRVF